MEKHANVRRPWQGCRRAMAVIGAAVERAPITLAALTCIGVGIYYNASFAAQYGPAAIALGIASDVLKSLAGSILVSAWRNAEYAKAVASFVALIVTLLLKADKSEAGGGWADEDITEALDTNLTMVARVREKLVIEGLDVVQKARFATTCSPASSVRRRRSSRSSTARSKPS